MQWQLFELIRSDIEQILEIEEISFKEPWSLTLFLEELICKDSFDYVVKTYGSKEPETVIAYICSRIIGDEMSILRIAVSKKWRCIGIASWLLNKLFEKAIFRGVTSVFLEVRSSNNEALALYNKSGFTNIGRRPNYYAETGEDALVLMKRLTSYSTID
ncbi:MAG: ribosomal protein S18-alanine N-acetyltransferase [Proteobacteria bacterium]|nr:ribosomal protein S18-alanine N-acetyltransferase [Pseudomonadota bacterium]MBU4037470.1 ribosomal protein S18-alanine N-acetyltransferase [Pseudomonadota bacterium]